MAYPTHGNEFHERQGWIAPCRAATTANITIATALNAADVLDGVTLATGDRVLVKDQSTGSQNGVYIVSASPLRAADYAASGDIVGSVVVVSEGTANADTAWACTTNAPITVGTTALVFAAFGGGSSAHDTSHEDGGADEIDLTGLSGTPAALTTHAGAADPHTGYVREADASWVDLTDSGATTLHSHAGGGPSAIAYSSGDVTVTGSLADMTGCSVSLTAGTYIVTGVFDVLVNNALNDRTFEGHLDSGGADQTNFGDLVAPGLVNVRAMITQSWRLVLASTTTVKLRARYSGGTVGDFTVKAQTVIAAWGAGTSVASDGIWDAAGDLAVGTGADTAARLAKGNAGAVLAMFNGAVAWNAGTSFPASPATGDRYYRTDKGLEYYFDGTRWLTTTLFVQNNIGPSAVLALSATANVGRVGTEMGTGTDMWLVSSVTQAFVASGGTALGASHKWVGTVVKADVNNNSGGTLDTYNLDSGASAVWRTRTTAIGALLGTAATYPILSIAWTKTGTPGNLSMVHTITFRLVQT